MLTACANASNTAQPAIYGRPIMTTIATALQAVQARLIQAAKSAGRNPGEIQLLAVSKTWGAEAVSQAHGGGQTAFAENYVQEAIDKITALKALSLQWHFIGPIQSNKTRNIAEYFDWVHSIDRLKIAERLSAARPAEAAPLQVCIQVNISGEQSKSGVVPEAVLTLAQQIQGLPRLRLRGLMGIAEATADTALQRKQFAVLRQLLLQLQAQGIKVDTLSMGMSHDLEAAIAEGATMVRVGTAIFGTRAN